MSKELEHGSEVLFVRIDKGNKIVESLVNFCQKQNIKGAWISGLGAVSSVNLALYDLENKNYIKKEIVESLEIASLVGNIGTLNGKVVAHIHGVFSNKDMVAYAGHLEEATVSATCEIKIEILDIELTRKHNEEIGLNIIDLR